MSPLPTRSASMSSKQPTAVSDSESDASDSGSPRETHNRGLDIDFKKLSPKGKGKGCVASSSFLENQHGHKTLGASIESLAGSPVEGYVNIANHLENDDKKTALGSTDIANITEGLALERLNGGIKDLDVDGHRFLMTSSLFEFYCNSKAADILNSGSGSANKYTRDSAEAKELGKRMFLHNSKLLSVHGLLHNDLEGDGFEPFRNGYHRLLDHLVSNALEGVDLNVVEASHGALVKEDGPARGTVLKENASENPFSRTAPMRIPSGRRLAARNDPENVVPEPGTFKPGSPHLQAFPAFNQPSYIQQDGLGRFTVEYAEDKVLIGKGGFGTVWRVRHLMDNQFYAVKKILLTKKQLSKLSGRTIKEIVTEVQTLAQLEHPNIVRYYGAWAEFDTTSTMPRSQSGKVLGLVEDKAQFNEDASNIASGDQEAGEDEEDSETSSREIEKADDFDIVFENSLDQGDHKNHHKISPRKAKQDDDEDDEVEWISRKFDKNPGFTETTDDPFTDDNGSLHATRTVRAVPLTLFIQMSLHPVCLAKYIKSRSGTGPRHCFHLLPALKIMLGIIDGVEYIHSRGIVHRDLKPGNILLGRHGSDIEAKCPACVADGLETWSYTIPRIGDFGLVTEISHRADPTAAAPNTVARQPVGTEFYRPRAASAVDESLDVFALGVVLFELVYQFGTTTERAMVLSGLTCSPSFFSSPPTKPELPKDFNRVMMTCVVKTCGPDISDDEAQDIVAMTTALILGMVEPEADKRWNMKEIRKALNDLVARVHAARS